MEQLGEKYRQDKYLHALAILHHLRGLNLKAEKAITEGSNPFNCKTFEKELADLYILLKIFIRSRQGFKNLVKERCRDLIISCCVGGEDRQSKYRIIQQYIEAALEAIKKLPEDKREPWISYLAESLECELGESALSYLHDIIEKRWKDGRW